MQYTQTELPVDGLLTNGMKEFFSLFKNKTKVEGKKEISSRARVCAIE